MPIQTILEVDPSLWVIVIRFVESVSLGSFQQLGYFWDPFFLWKDVMFDDIFIPLYHWIQGCWSQFLCWLRSLGFFCFGWRKWSKWTTIIFQMGWTTTYLFFFGGNLVAIGKFVGFHRSYHLKNLFVLGIFYIWHIWQDLWDRSLYPNSPFKFGGFLSVTH